MTLRVLIVDDEPIARRGIRARLAAEPDIEIVGECGDGASAIEQITDLAPDLVFLDVQMPELDGFDVVETVGIERMPAVIFVTAFDHYAVRAFDVHAVDYVLKPIDAARFARALDHVRQRLGESSRSLDARIKAALLALERDASGRHPQRLAVRANGRIRMIAVADIDWIEADGNQVRLHAGNKSLAMRATLTELVDRLDPDRFMRISRSALVQIEHVRELQPMFNGDFAVIMRDGTEIAGSRRHRGIFGKFGL